MSNLLVQEGKTDLILKNSKLDIYVVITVVNTKTTELEITYPKLESINEKK